MDSTGYAAITPAFSSDHKHIQPINRNVVTEGPFVEFTAPIVRMDVFKNFQLDEDMPYMGHDLDWSHRVASFGNKMGVHHGVVLKHTYIRNAKYSHSITDIRKKLRKNADASTEQKLIYKYGAAWKAVLNYQS
jgi:hypothetical protein